MKKSSERRFGEPHKSSESEFGDTADKPKNIGRTAQKIIDLVISDLSMSAEAMAYKIRYKFPCCRKTNRKIAFYGYIVSWRRRLWWLLAYYFKLPFWGDETQHAASLQLETKLGEKSKLACFGSEVLEFENQIKYYTFAWLDKSKQIIGIKQW